MTLIQNLKNNTFLAGYLRKRRINTWVNCGRPIPAPHDTKQLAVLYYSVAYGLDILVETGTYLGDMIWAQKDYFQQIYSIELSKELFVSVKNRFKSFNHIKLIQGDSGEKIAEVLSEIESPALFWLDGHYSGGITAKGEKLCPIYGELSHIFKSSMQHLILIDDARCFIGDGDYPSLGELNAYTVQNSNYQMNVENDIIVLRARSDS